VRTWLALVLVSAAALPASAQPFSNAASALAKYSVAEVAPNKTCESLSAFKGVGIVSIAARVVASSPSGSSRTQGPGC
jgi:hypothetical protein